MNTLVLNHIRTAEPSLGGYFSLVLGLIALVGAGLWQQHVWAEQEVLRKALNLRSHQQQQSAATTVVTQPPESAAVQQAIQHIVLPWSDLLKGMESVQREDIKLMSFVPAWKSKQIRLSLLATNREAIWGYMEDLRQLRMVKEVNLKSSESTHLNGMPVITFEVEMQWNI